MKAKIQQFPDSQKELTQEVANANAVTFCQEENKKPIIALLRY